MGVPVRFNVSSPSSLAFVDFSRYALQSCNFNIANDLKFYEVLWRRKVWESRQKAKFLWDNANEMRGIRRKFRKPPKFKF